MEFIGVWGLVTATYRQRHRTSKKGRTDGLHYTRRRPLFNAGGLIPHGRRLDAGMREHVRRAPARRSASSLQIRCLGSSTWRARATACPPARGPLRSLWSRLAGEGTGRRETGRGGTGACTMQAGRQNAAAAVAPSRIGSAVADDDVDGRRVCWRRGHRLVRRTRMRLIIYSIQGIPRPAAAGLLAA